MLARPKISPYTSDILLSKNQQKYLVDQVIAQLEKFYSGDDTRKMVLNAFTGSGKTTVAIKSLIPEVIGNFYGKGKRAIGFIAPLREVVDKTCRLAKESLNNKVHHGAKIKVYSSNDIDQAKKEVRSGRESSLDGDVVLIFMTAQYFYYNYAALTASANFDLMIVDEAHLMFGTVSKEDTKADKGVRNENFVAETYTKLRSMTDCAVLFLTATPTNSQQELTDIGAENNIYLEPMPRDVLTTPFYDVIPYSSNDDTVFSGLVEFKRRCDLIGEVMSRINNDTWEKSKGNFFPTYPAVLVRLGQRNALSGVNFDDNFDRIEDFTKRNSMALCLSTAYQKVFNGKPIDSLDQGITLAEKNNRTPVVLVTINSGYAGLDLVKITDVIIGRDPKGTIHNNYSQTAGRAARMKFGFRNHMDAAKAIKEYDISDEQKMLLANYYCLHSASKVHVCVENKLLNNDVREFIETDTFRGKEGMNFIKFHVFSNEGDQFKLVTKTEIENNGYQKYKKDHCECCEVNDQGKTSCYWTAFNNFAKAYQQISEEEMDVIWKMSLQVHHKDGNHFNNDPSNLLTLCPNVHSLITMHDEDYSNRYPDLRRKLDMYI